MQDWIEEGLPQEPGDYLWVSMWSCNCCVRQNGIAWIRMLKGVTSTDPNDTEWNDGPPDYLYKNEAGMVLELNFGKEKPHYIKEDKEWDVDGWLKLKLPDCREPATNSDWIKKRAKQHFGTKDVVVDSAGERENWKVRVNGKSYYPVHKGNNNYEFEPLES